MIKIEANRDKSDHNVVRVHCEIEGSGPEIVTELVGILREFEKSCPHELSLAVTHRCGSLQKGM